MMDGTGRKLRPRAAGEETIVVVESGDKGLTLGFRP